MKKLLVAASFSASFALLSSAAVAASITNTGPSSKNKIKVMNSNVCTVKNNNSVGVSNSVKQKAKTGSASVKHNTEGGSATTGDAANTSTNGTSVALANNGQCGSGELAVMNDTCGSDASIDTTGPSSWNWVFCGNTQKVKVVNNNAVSVGNMVVQNATSGNASVWGNTTGGDATSGDASNTSTNTVTITVTNN